MSVESNDTMMWRRRVTPYLFLLPALALFGVFLIWPLAKSLELSFYTTAGPEARKYVGLGNYRFLIFHDRIFWLAVLNTVAFTVAFLVVQIPLSLGLAMLLDSRRAILRGVVRFCFFSTYLCGQVFVAVIFFALFGRRWPLGIGWLTDPRWTLVTLLIAAVWLSTGYAMVFLLAALRGVERELYE